MLIQITMEDGNNTCKTSSENNLILIKADKTKFSIECAGKNVLKTVKQL